jgi:hypothetical protein
MGNDLYFLLSMGSIVDEYPNGIYRVESDGDFTLIADITAFNEDNPVDFPDQAPGGNPFALDVRGSNFIVSDGNFNRVLQVTSAGAITILAEYGNVVPTGLETGAGSGPVFQANLGPAPHAPETGKIVSIAVPSGTTTDVASGVSWMIDVEYGLGNQLYGLSFSEQTEDENAPPSGSIVRVNTGAGTMSRIVGGFAAPTSLDIAGNTAFVTNLLGQVWKIENLSTLQPLPAASPTVIAPAPTTPAAAVATATPGTGIAAPDTGTGAASEGGSLSMLVVLVAAAGVAVASAGGALAIRRR